MLFNFGSKRKLGITSMSNMKKVALTFWDHEFTCHSDTEQDQTPTAQERTVQTRYIYCGQYCVARKGGVFKE